jgi:hypothetical protein
MPATAHCLSAHAACAGHGSQHVCGFTIGARASPPKVSFLQRTCIQRSLQEFSTFCVNLDNLELGDGCIVGRCNMRCPAHWAVGGAGSVCSAGHCKNRLHIKANEGHVGHAPDARCLGMRNVLDPNHDACGNSLASYALLWTRSMTRA